MRSNRFAILISTIVLIISLILIIGLKSNILSPSYALEDTHKITIKKETDVNPDEEFIFMIKAWKEESEEMTFSEVVNAEHSINDINTPIHMINNDFFKPDFSYETDYEKNISGFFGWRQDNESSVYMVITDNSFPVRLIDGSVYDVSKDPFTIINENQYRNINLDGESIYIYEIMTEEEFSDYYASKQYYYNKYELDGKSCEIKSRNMHGFCNGCESELTCLITKNYYLDLSSQLGDQIEENTYRFTLKNNETIDINMPEGYNYTIEELPNDSFELVSINEDTSLSKVEDSMGTTEMTYIFKSKSINVDPVNPDDNGSNNNDNTNTNSNEDKPKLENKNSIKNEVKKQDNKNAPKTGINYYISNAVLIIGLSVLFFSVIVLTNQVFKTRYIR